MLVIIFVNTNKFTSKRHWFLDTRKYSNLKTPKKLRIIEMEKLTRRRYRIVRRRYKKKKKVLIWKGEDE